MVADTLSCKTANSFIHSMCMRISVDSLLLDQIREAQVEEVKKEN